MLHIIADICNTTFRKAKISEEKQVFLVGFSLTIPRFPQTSKNRLNTSLARQQLYNARPKVQKDGDLTRRCYQLLSEASRIVKNINAINFAFVNINCSLKVRYDSSFDYFNSKQKLNPTP